MYCDKDGRPDPNGDYQMLGGKMILRDGRRVSFSHAFMDSQTGSPTAGQVFLRDNPTMFTDAERQLFDSDEGRVIIARAEMMHRQQYAHLGDRAPIFTDGSAAKAIKSEMARRGRPQNQGVDAVKLDEMRSNTATARAEMIADMATRHLRT